MIQIPTHPNYHENAEKCGDDYPCVVCGKPVRSKKRKMVHLWWGTHLVTNEEAGELDPAGDMNLYPIGNDCLRNHPEIKPYVVSIDSNFGNLD